MDHALAALAVLSRSDPPPGSPSSAASSRASAASTSKLGSALGGVGSAAAAAARSPGAAIRAARRRAGQNGSAAAQRAARGRARAGSGPHTGSAWPNAVCWGSQRAAAAPLYNPDCYTSALGILNCSISRKQSNSSHRQANNKRWWWWCTRTSGGAGCSRRRAGLGCSSMASSSSRGRPTRSRCAGVELIVVGSGSLCSEESAPQSGTGCSVHANRCSATPAVRRGRVWRHAPPCARRFPRRGATSAWCAPRLHAPTGARSQDDESLALIQRVFTDELMGVLLGRLGPYALGRAACVCKQWRYLCRVSKRRRRGGRAGRCASAGGPLAARCRLRGRSPHGAVPHPTARAEPRALGGGGEGGAVAAGAPRHCAGAAAPRSGEQVWVRGTRRAVWFGQGAALARRARRAGGRREGRQRLAAAGLPVAGGLRAPYSRGLQGLRARQPGMRAGPSFRLRVVALHRSRLGSQLLLAAHVPGGASRAVRRRCAAGSPPGLVHSSSRGRAQQARPGAPAGRPAYRRSRRAFPCARHPRPPAIPGTPPRSPRLPLAPPRAAVYVARNTYIRVGAVELHRTNTVHLACYYRYYRFFPNGTVRRGRGTRGTEGAAARGGGAGPAPPSSFGGAGRPRAFGGCTCDRSCPWFAPLRPANERRPLTPSSPPPPTPACLR
jgi:hypothetical protein